MTITSESLRSDLAGLADAGARTAASATRIRDAARDRRDTVQSRLDELRPLTSTDHGAVDEYQALIAERGQLDVVLAGS